MYGRRGDVCGKNLGHFRNDGACDAAATAIAAPLPRALNGSWGKVSVEDGRCNTVVLCNTLRCFHVHNFHSHSQTAQSAKETLETPMCHAEEIPCCHYRTVCTAAVPSLTKLPTKHQ